MDPVLLMLTLNQSVLVTVNGQDVIVQVSINTRCKISGIPCSPNPCLNFLMLIATDSIHKCKSIYHNVRLWHYLPIQSVHITTKVVN